MEEMNADNRKVDAAVNGLETRKAAFVKLKEITTTTGNVAQIDVDVSDIVFTDWQYIIVDVWMNSICCMQINSRNDSSCVSIGGSGSYSAASYIYSDSRITFHVCEEPKKSVTATTVAFQGCFVERNGLYFSQIKTLNFVVQNSQWTFSPSCKIKITGVR